jgi:hypothetical protein
MKHLLILITIKVVALSTFSFGQSVLTDSDVQAAIQSGFVARNRHIGLTLNDVQTNILSSLVCKTCGTSGYTIYVYTPESWIQLQAVHARREMLPFTAADVSPEMKLPFIHVLASPSRPEYLNANGMAMASSVHRIVLSSTDRTDIVQPLSESHSTVESNSAFRSFTQASAGAVFSVEDVERLRAKDPKGEFFIVVVGDNQNKYFKVKSRFFAQLFGNRTYVQAQTAKADIHETTEREPERKNAVSINPQEPSVSASLTAHASPASASPAVASLVSSASVATALRRGPASPSSNPALSLLGISARTLGQDGAEIVNIALDSAAADAGLHAGYVIVSVDGKRVRSVAALEGALVNRRPGSKVTLGYWFPSNLGWMPGTDKVLTLNQ